MGGVGFFMVMVGGVFLYLLSTNYIWVFHFDYDLITLRRTFGVHTYDPRYITHLELLTEERTVKGFAHQVHRLCFHFMDGTIFDIAPNLPSFPLDYSSVDEARTLTELKTTLEMYYVAVVVEDVEPAMLDMLADERWGRPQSAYQWTIRPFDLTVTRLDCGEHHAAASTIHILVGHVEAGAMRFRTTNGEIRVSPDGRYLAIFDATLLLVFNLANGRTYHRSSRQAWLYSDVQIVDCQLCIEEMKLTDAQQRELRKPIVLESPTSALRRGLGSASGGDFPSAYG